MPQRVVKRFRDLFGKIKKADFENWYKFSHSPTFTWIALIGFAIIVTLLTTVSLQRVPKALDLGSVATRDIKADRDYEIVDEEATASFRDEAREAVLPLYAFDEGLVSAITKRVHESFQETRLKAYEFVAINIRKQQKPIKQGKHRPFILTEADKQKLSEMFVQKLGVTPDDSQWKMLIRERFSSRVESIMVDMIEQTMRTPVVAERGTLDAQKERGILVQRTRQEGEEKVTVGETKVSDLTTIFSTEEVRAKIAKVELPTQGLFSRHSRALILKLGSGLIEPNCVFERQISEERVNQAVANVKNVIIKLQAGEIIIRNGSRFEPWHHKVLNGIQRERGRGSYTYDFLGIFLLVCLIILVPFYLGERYLQRFHPTRTDYVLMVLVAVISLLILRVATATVPLVQQSLYFTLPERSLLYALPITIGVMLIRMLLSIESALIYAIPMAVFSAFFAETGLRFVVFALISNFAAVIAINRVDRRTAIIRAGAVVGLVNVISVLAISFLNVSSISGQLYFSSISAYCLLAFMGGVSAALVSMIILPMVESVSGYVTDIKLLELANLNHPLLRELIVRAPGTYHHSHLVGVLAEAAAESIGSNALLVRVAAYYHDVGKMKKAAYFIENNKGESKHKKLSPHMSALIVASHVKDGVDMAEAAGIPKVIVDMIPQHHGTRKIGFFFEKAKAQVDPSIQTVNEKDFCYAGPKPQSPEAAILMLADVVEASVRSLQEKSALRIQQTVERSINDVFSESQLDECELTLKDLNDIGKAFIHILLGIYHQRIDYQKEATFSSGKFASDAPEKDGLSEIYDLQSASSDESSDESPLESSEQARASRNQRKG